VPQYKRHSLKPPLRYRLRWAREDFHYRIRMAWQDWQPSADAIKAGLALAAIAVLLMTLAGVL
jgi:hypothetical protein